MPSVNCSFCDHANPADAKFCNECGAGLGLRPCAQCDAINDVAATFCHQCGALLGAAATAVASAAKVEGAHATPSSPLLRSQSGSTSATDTTASLPEVGAGKTAFASPRELASAAERLDAFWRDSMQAVEVARAMKGDVTPPQPPARAVDMLPLRVMDDTPVIDAGPDPGMALRRGPRIAIAAALLVVAAGVVYYGYERTSIRSAATPEANAPPIATPAVVTAPTTASPVIVPSTEAASNAVQATSQPPAANALTATSPAVSGDAAAPSPGGVKDATVAGPQPSVPRDAAVNEPAASPRDESTATAARTDASTVSTPPDTAATTDTSTNALGPNAGDAQPQVNRGSGGDAASSPAVSARHAPARTRPSTARATTTPRSAAPRQWQPAAPVVAAPPPAARTAVPPMPAASCTDSTAALGLCSR
jgi:hypothetical protein